MQGLANSGSHSLCFLYHGKPSGQDSTAEQKFELGRPVTEVWVKYFIRFPRNYFHRADSPSNNKFFYFWSKDYQDEGDEVSWHLWASGDTGNSVLTYVTFDEYGHHPNLKDGIPKPVFVDRSRDLERWIKVILHWKRQSGPDEADGVVQVWASDRDGSLRNLISATNLTHTWGRYSNYNFVDRGYVLGWANSGFEQDTDICIDDISFSEEPPGELAIPKPVTGTTVK